MLKMNKKGLKSAFQSLKSRFSIGNDGVIPTGKYPFKNRIIYK